MQSKQKSHLLVTESALSQNPWYKQIQISIARLSDYKIHIKRLCIAFERKISRLYQDYFQFVNIIRIY